MFCSRIFRDMLNPYSQECIIFADLKRNWALWRFETRNRPCLPKIAKLLFHAFKASAWPTYIVVAFLGSRRKNLIKNTNEKSATPTNYHKAICTRTSNFRIDSALCLKSVKVSNISTSLLCMGGARIIHTHHLRTECYAMSHTLLITRSSANSGKIVQRSIVLNEWIAYLG